MSPSSGLSSRSASPPSSPSGFARASFSSSESPTSPSGVTTPTPPSRFVQSSTHARASLSPLATQVQEADAIPSPFSNASGTSQEDENLQNPQDDVSSVWSALSSGGRFRILQKRWFRTMNETASISTTCTPPVSVSCDDTEPVSQSTPPSKPSRDSPASRVSSGKDCGPLIARPHQSPTFDETANTASSSFSALTGGVATVVESLALSSTTTNAADVAVCEDVTPNAGDGGQTPRFLVSGTRNSDGTVSEEDPQHGDGGDLNETSEASGQCQGNDMNQGVSSEVSTFDFVTQDPRPDDCGLEKEQNKADETSGTYGGTAWTLVQDDNISEKIQPSQIVEGAPKENDSGQHFDSRGFLHEKEEEDTSGGRTTSESNFDPFANGPLPEDPSSADTLQCSPRKSGRGTAPSVTSHLPYVSHTPAVESNAKEERKKARIIEDYHLSNSENFNNILKQLETESMVSLDSAHYPELRAQIRSMALALEKAMDKIEQLENDSQQREPKEEGDNGNLQRETTLLNMDVADHQEVGIKQIAISELTLGQTTDEDEDGDENTIGETTVMSHTSGEAFSLSMSEKMFVQRLIHMKKGDNGPKREAKQQHPAANSSPWASSINRLVASLLGEDERVGQLESGAHEIIQTSTHPERLQTCALKMGHGGGKKQKPGSWFAYCGCEPARYDDACLPGQQPNGNL